MVHTERLIAEYSEDTGISRLALLILRQKTLL